MDLLLIAQSARILAQSARRAGLDACAIDYFADTDTRRYAVETIALNPGPDGFEADELLAIAQRLPAANLIYGSGIDNRPDLVEALAVGRTLFGNTPQTLRRANTPAAFFSLLDTLGIPHPETRFTAPDTLAGWLVKPGCGEGGKRVGFAAKNRPFSDAYYQRHIDGPAYSLLFLANGQAARTVGFNTQWTASHDSEQPFLFAGAVNRAELSAAQRLAVVEYATALAAALNLVGLNSLDFVLGNGECLVLEINPRPSATMALYDEDFAQGLLAAHIAACRGELPSRDCPGPVRALRTVYAPRPLVIPAGIDWPSGCADIPNAGGTIGIGQPLCSLMAEGKNQREVETLLAATEYQLLCGIYDRTVISFGEI